MAALALMGIGAMVAVAQTPPPSAADGMGDMGIRGGAFAQMHRADPATMQARFDKLMDRFKTLLQLTPEQEGAWAAFRTAMTPPATRPDVPKPEEFEKLTTPERLDRLHRLRVQRAERMDQREAAAKTFYAALTPSQRKVFDLETLKVLNPQHRMQWLRRMLGMGSSGF